MSIPTSASEFFENWVPSRLAEVLSNGVQLNTRCSVEINVGNEAWILAANNGRVEVKKSAGEVEANLVVRASVSPSLFTRFVLAELANSEHSHAEVPQNSPLLKLFNLDSESLNLIQNIPGALQLVINDGDDSSYRAIFAPASQRLEPAACTLKCSLADAQALRAGTVQPMELFFSGRLQLEGDPQVAMALAGLLM